MRKTTRTRLAIESHLIEMQQKLMDLLRIPYLDEETRDYLQTKQRLLKEGRGFLLAQKEHPSFAWGEEKRWVMGGEFPLAHQELIQDCLLFRHQLNEMPMEGIMKEQLNEWDQLICFLCLDGKRKNERTK